MMNILNGIKILDFSRLLPGPMATKQLMQMGAEVIKIEHPNKPELTRLIPPFEDGISVSYLMVNKGKEVRQIQYETEEGRNEIYELVKEVDVLIETFRPGTMQTLGFGYDILKTINPQLIYVSCTSYGQSGPYAHLAGHDLNFMAYSGLLANNINADGNITMPSYQVADLYGGTEQIINSVLLGIIQRTKTAKGDWFDVSITEAALPMNALLAPPVWYNEKAQAFDVLSGKLPHYTYYKCKDGKFVVLAGLEDKFWQNLCTKLGREEWKSENLMTLIHRQDIRQALIDLFIKKTRDQWVEFFQDTEVCFSPVLEFEETLSDPHFKEKGSYMFTEDGKHIIGFNLGIRQIG